jgi:hypothetical protein
MYTCVSIPSLKDLLDLLFFKVTANVDVLFCYCRTQCMSLLFLVDIQHETSHQSPLKSNTKSIEVTALLGTGVGTE